MLVRFFLLLIVLFVTSCKEKSSQTAAVNSNLTRYTPQYAKGFFWEKGENFTILYITQPFSNKIDTLRYALSNNINNIPQEWLKKTTFIQIPLKRLVSTSTTHFFALELLESLHCLVASNSLQYTYSANIQKQAQKGKIVALNEETLDFEKIVDLRPNLLMVSAMPDTKMGIYQKVQQAKIPVLPNAEWLEEHPLGKAEWIKLFGLLLQKEKQAEIFFDSVAKKYNQLKELAKKIEKPKTVAVGFPQKDVWYVPAGNSFGAIFLQDANLVYPFAADTGRGSLPISKEIAFSRFAGASIWLNAEIPSQLSQREFCQYQQIIAVQQGNIYDRQKRISPNGGNDYWERGVFRPDEILTDLIQIAYPHLLPSSRELMYYRKLTISCL